MGEVPESVDNSASAPPVMSQGNSSSCTAHAVSAGLYGTAKGTGVALAPWFPASVPSQLGIYNATREIARAAILPAGWDAPLPDLEDKGAMPSDVLAAISTVGIRARKPLPPDDSRNSDVDPGALAKGSTLLDLEEEHTTMVTGEYFLDENASDYIPQLCATLAAKIWVPVGIFVDTIGERSVEGWNPATGPLGAPDTSDKDGGNHYVAIHSYRTLPNGKKVFRFRNSWGAGWGLGGDGEGDEDFIAGTNNAMALTIRRPA